MTKDDAYTLTTPDGSGSMELPVRKGTLGPDVLDIGRLYREQGVFTYDPGFRVHRAAAIVRSRSLTVRRAFFSIVGYPVEQLAKLIRISSRSPTCCCAANCRPKIELAAFETSITRHTMLNEGMLRFFTGFRYDAHPMAMLSAVVGSMSAYYHDTMDINDPNGA